MMKKTQHVSLGKKGSFTVHKGALHRALGIPEGKTIPMSKKRAASKQGGRVGRMARSALGFAAMHHGKHHEMHSGMHPVLKHLHRVMHGNG